MTELPVLTTPRLTLRILGPESASRCITYGSSNAEFHKPWLPPLIEANFDPFAVAAMREQAVRNAQARTAYSFALLPGGGGDDVPIYGWLSFSGIHRGVFQACTMGYSLDRLVQGQGYMTEAAEAGIAFVFETIGLHRIEAAYLPHNQRSANVLRRLGFTVEGHAKNYLFIAGQWRDHVLTSLTNPDVAPPPGYGV